MSLTRMLVNTSSVGIWRIWGLKFSIPVFVRNHSNNCLGNCCAEFYGSLNCCGLRCLDNVEDRLELVGAGTGQHYRLAEVKINLDIHRSPRPL